MKARKRFGAVLSVVLAMMLSFTTFAKDYEVSDWTKMEEAFADQASAEIVIILKGDISCQGQLSALEGKTYVINGREYVLKNVKLAGDGEVTINTDIAGDSSAVYAAALEARENVNVTVNGDVNSDGIGIQAYGAYGDSDNSPEVTVNGNVNSKENAVTAIDAEVNVEGDVTASQGNGVISQDAKVNVTGSVEGGTNGVFANGDEAEVTVGGDVTATGGEDGVIAQNGIVAQNGSTVTVEGDVKGGDVEAGYAGAGVVIDGMSETEVQVGGDVIGGSITGENAGTSDDGAGYGVVIVLQSAVNRSVGTGKESDRQDYQSPAAKLVVQGTITGGDDANGGASAIYYQVGAPDSNLDEMGEDIKAAFEDNKFSESDMDAFIEQTSQNGSDSDLLVMMLDDWGIPVYIEPTVAEKYIPQWQQAIFEQFDAITGGSLEDIYNVICNGEDDEIDAAWAEIESLLEKTSLQERKNMIRSILETRNSIIDKIAEDMIKIETAIEVEKLMDNKSNPDITAWGIKGGNDGTASALESDAGQLLAEILGEDINYLIRTETVGHGTITVQESAKSGDRVPVQVRADEGYQVGRVLLNGAELSKDADGNYYFIVPENVSVKGETLISAEFTKKGTDAVEPVSKKAPETGDENPVVIYAVSLLMSVAILVIMLKKRKYAKMQ